MKTFSVWYLVELLVDAPTAEEITKQQPVLGERIGDVLNLNMASPTIQIGRVASDGWDELKQNDLTKENLADFPFWHPVQGGDKP